MTPRLKTSKKWTSFPADLVQQIQTAFTENFQKEGKNGEFRVEGWIYPEEIILRVGYLGKGRLQQSNMEISADVKNTEQAVQKIHLVVDAAASLFVEFFDRETEDESDSERAEKLDLPLVWKEISFENDKVYLQYTTVNSSLEAEADKLLEGGLAENALVYESDEEADDDDLSASADDDDAELDDSDEISDDDEGAPPPSKKKPKRQLH